MLWQSPDVNRLVDAALKEDAAFLDITTHTLIPPKIKIESQIQSKGHGVVCGLPLAEAFFRRLDRRIVFTPRVREGQAVRPGTVLAVMRGEARAILAAERSALNALQHLSGVATFTRQQVKNLSSRKTAIYDTRKTLPGWRELQKYAVRCGGGRNHRMSLAQSVLIKDNHLMICRLMKADWMAAIRRLRKKRPSLAVEMEVQSGQDFREAIQLAPDQILLDNLPQSTLRKLIRQIHLSLPKTEIEISGGIRPDQIPSLSKLGVDRISLGRLTHSAPAFDCALEITRVLNPR